MSELKEPVDLAALAELSARIGSNPDIIQAAGGNTSIKENGVMWIKASGTLLAEAQQKDIFVPVDATAMCMALADPDQDADQPINFALGQSGLRPSIETSLHAVFDQRVVVHVHCVNTLSWAIQQGSDELLATKLLNFKWASVGYCKPGAMLASAVSHVIDTGAEIVILKNHGLIVAAETVHAAETLLFDVIASLEAPMRPFCTIDVEALGKGLPKGWEALDKDHPLHQVALSPARITHATTGSLYPDHVIFCGIGAQILTDDDPAATQEAPPFYIVPDRGAIIQCDASQGAKALVRCLGDVLMRLDEDAVLEYLSDEQNYQLLDWDAEKYRQKLNA